MSTKTGISPTLTYAENLTSSVYGKENPPKDWADISLLVPHECIRREEKAMLASVDMLRDLVQTKSAKSWQALYFCQWFTEVFVAFVHEHHDIEENLYFPWLQTKVVIPAKQFAKGHKDLMTMLDELDGICKKVVGKQGIDCDKEVLKLHEKMHDFVVDMNEHLMEEERDIPPLARLHFTEEEEGKLVEKIGRQEASLKVLRNMFPAIMESMKEWGTPALRDDFEKKFPGLLRHLSNKYWNPDYETWVRPKRDAPLLQTEPFLTRVGCFGFSFCFPCIL